MMTLYHVSEMRRVPAAYLAPVYTSRSASPGGRPLPAGAVAGLVAVVAFNALVLHGEATFARALLGFPVSVVVPGALALLLLGGRPRRGWDWLLHAVTLSVAVLIVLGTVLALLPGAALTATSCLVAFDVAVAGLATAAAWRRRRTRVRQPAVQVDLDRPGRARTRVPIATTVGLVFRVVLPGFLDARGLRRLDPGLTAAAVGLSSGVNAVALAVYGARHLNGDGGSGPTTGALLAGVVAFVAAVVAARAHRVTAAATIVYLLAAAVLLATSLRGDGVTGHDIKIEYRVFLDTLSSGSWLPGGPYPGYNSCLSLTVLPSFLSRLLGLSALDVFRVCFQLVFAVVPVGALLIARRLLPPGYAVLSAGLFIAFPTFVNDMPMLNRQEIALLFFTVGLLALLDRGEPSWRRNTLFAVAAVGMTVSHYSSAAVAAGLLTGAWLVRGVRIRVQQRIGGAEARQPGIWPAALTMIVLVVGWSAVTGSASAFAADLTATARAVGGGAPVLSDATRYAPVGAGGGVDDATALRAYTERLLAQRADDGARPAPACVTTVVSPDELPPTRLGTAVASMGVSPTRLNSLVRQGFVVLFQLGAVAGCVLLWWRPRRRSAAVLVAELTTAGVGLLGVSLVVPQLTDSYGLLRLYQQLLPVLGIAVLIALIAGVGAAARLGTTAASATTGRRRGPRSTVAVAVTLVVAACLVTTTGLLPRLTGGYPPQLNLANAGPYYRGYLAGPEDVGAAQWIRDHLPADAWVVADSRDTANLRAFTGLSPDEGIAPGAVPADAYLLLTVDGTDAVATAVVGDRIIRYVLPLGCLTDGRSVLHIDGSHVLYGPYGR